jgi:hypothetical protein
MIHFPRKDIFLFQPLARFDRRIEKPKSESLKYFEICDVQETELLVNRSTYINPIGTVICPKQKQSMV